MATKLKEIIKNSALLSADSNSVWFANGINGFNPPFNAIENVLYGTKEWEKSLYSQFVDSQEDLRPCFAVRKAVYRLFYNRKGAKLGYLALKEDDTWCSFYDGTMGEVNSIITSDHSPCDRWIHLHLHNGKVVDACLYEGGKQKGQYKIGQGRGYHSPTAYIYAEMVDLIYRDKEWRKRFLDLEEEIKDSQNGKPCATLAKDLTLFENDVYVSIAQKSENSLFKPSIDPYTDAISEGADFKFDNIGNQKPKSVKMVNTFKTVAEASASGKYKLNHVFTTGEEALVPDFYCDFDLTAEEEKMCKLIKGSELMATKRGNKRQFLNFMLQGEAGTGKSTAAAKIAQICGLPWRTFSCSAGTEEMDLLKKIVPNPSSEGRANIYVDSEIVETFRNGGVIEIQEVNLIQREGVINILNRGLDDFGLLRLAEGSYVHRHPDCIVIFTMNPDYEGTRPVNQSLLSRCQQIVEYNLPSKEKMVERVAKEHPIDLGTLNEMAESLFEVRRVIEDESVCDGICSYRELNAWAEEIDNLMNIWGEECNPYEAALNTVVNHATADKDVRAQIAGVIQKRFAAF